MSRAPGVRPRLEVGVRMRADPVRGCEMLLYPEGAIALNHTAAAVLELCDGHRTIDEIVTALAARFSDAVVRDEVEELLDAMEQLGLLTNADR